MEKSEYKKNIKKERKSERGGIYTTTTYLESFYHILSHYNLFDYIAGDAAVLAAAAAAVYIVEVAVFVVIVAVVQ